MGDGFMALTAGLMLFAPQPPDRRVSRSARIRDNLPVVELAITFLAIAALFQLVDGAQAVGSGMLRGLHDTRVPMLFAALGYWGIGLPLGALLGFPLGLGGIGIWIGLAAGLTVVGVLMMTRWMMRDRLGLTGARDRYA